MLTKVVTSARNLAGFILPQISYMNIYDHILTLSINWFARGGGGGSGGGGGGGGGGSSHGGGHSLTNNSLLDFLLLIFFGIIIPYSIGSFLHKKQSKRLLILPITLMITCTVAFCCLPVPGYDLAVFAMVSGTFGYFELASSITIGFKKLTNAKKTIKKAASKDPIWEEEITTTYVRRIFAEFQKDWSTFDIDHIRSYTTPNYANYVHLMLSAIYLRGRRNEVCNPRITKIYPIDAKDDPDNSKDSITFCIYAKADDYILETVDNKEQELFVDHNEFGENWHFKRCGNMWLLDSIEQHTQNELSANSNIKEFAKQNNMHYNLDSGWLLLPNRGQLFDQGRFGKSDINNHVIGTYHNLIVELYTYQTNAGNVFAPIYTVAQVSLPKRYKSIVVKAKNNRLLDLFELTPKGYNKLSLEWPDFNKRYKIYATNTEQATAFELLHPKYMEKLFNLPFKVSIEVTDNVVYLYTEDPKSNYSTMLELLKDAFKEMRL